MWAVSCRGLWVCLELRADASIDKPTFPWKATQTTGEGQNAEEDQHVGSGQRKGTARRELCHESEGNTYFKEKSRIF